MFCQKSCRGSGLSKKISARPAAEALEDRTLLSSYFVSTNGADANPGTLAQPFATIQHAADLAQPGDTVFVRGGTYRETVTPPRSGTASAPIIFEPYNGESVTISGADLVTGWSRYQGSVYQATPGWNLGEGNGQILVDGAMVNEAAWPNTGTDLFQPGSVSATSISSSVSVNGPFGGTATATIKSSALTQPAGAWVGATIHIAPGDGWVWQTGTVISSQVGQLVYQYTQLNTQYQIPRAGNPFYLTGKFQTLDSSGEWFQDANTGALYLWTPHGDSPASHVVEVKHRLYAFDLSGLSYVDVRGFDLFADSIKTSAASGNLTLSNLNVQYVSQSTINPNPFATKLSAPTTGILIEGDNIIFSDSTIGFSSGNGVALTGIDDTVQNCFIHDVDYSGGDFGGVLVMGTGDSVVHSTIWNAGRDGVTQYFSGGDHIFNNVIHDFGLMTSDAGGTYAWQTNGQGTEIAYNQIYNGRGGGFGNTGLFLDNGDSNFIIDHNLAWNCDNATKLSAPAHDDQVYNNTLVGVQYSLGSSFPTDMQGSIVENNILDGPVIWGTGVTENHNLNSSNPGFISASGNNYQLATGSAAIDAGAIVVPYTNGYLGAAPDLGAYESGAAPFAAGATAVAPPVYTPDPVGSPPASAPPSAASVLAASTFSSASGAQIAPNGSVSAAGGDWIGYGAIDFGTGVKSIQMQLVALTRKLGLRIQLRLDSLSGTLIGTLSPSGGRRGMVLHTQKASTRHITGIHALYLVVVGRKGQIAIESFTFVPLPHRSKA